MFVIKFNDGRYYDGAWPIDQIRYAYFYASAENAKKSIENHNKRYSPKYYDYKIIRVDIKEVEEVNIDD